jgi:hypothetical protein
MDERAVVCATAVPAPRRSDTDPVQVTCEGAGQPPLPVLARVQHVFSGAVAATVWPVLRRELRSGAVTSGELVLLRVGRGERERWTELVVTGDREY